MQLKLTLLALTLLFGTTVVRAANLVVIASTTAHLSVGMIVDGAEKIALGPGTAVTLISEDGRTVHLNGPYLDQPDAASGQTDGSLVTVLSRLLGNTVEPSESLATWRAQESAKPSDPWSLDITRSAVFCLPAGGPAFLSRPRTVSSIVVRFEAVDGGRAPIKRKWPAGECLLAWPHELRLKDRAVYRIGLQGTLDQRILKIAIIPKSLATAGTRAVWMVEQGCAQQARRLIQRTGKAIR